MSITPNTKVIIPLGIIGSFIIGLAYFLFDFTKSNSQQQPTNPSVNSTITANPSITSNANPSINFNVNPSTQTNDYSNPSVERIDSKIREMSNENNQLRQKNSTITNQNLQLTTDVNILKKQRDDLITIINSCNDSYKNIQTLKQENDEYLKQIQKTGGYMMYEPTAQQKDDYRLARQQNLEMIAGYQDECRNIKSNFNNN